MDTETSTINPRTGRPYYYYGDKAAHDARNAKWNPFHNAVSAEAVRLATSRGLVMYGSKRNTTPEQNRELRAEARANVGTFLRPYVRAVTPEIAAPSEPVFPRSREEKTRVRNDLQNKVADLVLAEGYEPKTWSDPEARFAVAWEANNTLFIADVRSVSETNARDQFARSLYRVLRHREVAMEHGFVFNLIRLVIVLEEQPTEREVQVATRLGICVVVDSPSMDLFGELAF